MDTADVIAATLQDLANRRGCDRIGGLPFDFLEIFGGRLVETSMFEPDPRTYRWEYYYNVTLNKLFRRIVVDKQPNGIIIAKWLQASI